jgi:hypothetical protein
MIISDRPTPAAQARRHGEQQGLAENLREGSKHFAADERGETQKKPKPRRPKDTEEKQFVFVE